VIENTQRHQHRASMNELQIIFDKLGIRPRGAERQRTQVGHFLPFERALSAALYRCRPVLPRVTRPKEIHHHPQIIMAGRRINEAMGRYYARHAREKMIHRQRASWAAGPHARITFKENVPDIRKSHVLDIIGELKNSARKSTSGAVAMPAR